MGLSIGIVGLPNAGKSTVFNALTRAAVAVAPYPFTTVEPHRGVVPVPDARLEAVARVTRPERTVPATVEFVDIAGLVRGASRGEGLGNQFLAHIREVDAVAHIVRCFPAPDVPHVEGVPDPQRDIEIVETELALADLSVVEREMERQRGRARAHDARAAERLDALTVVADALKRGGMVRRLPAASEQVALLRPLRLLTAKPVVYVANIAEEDLPGGGPGGDQVRRHARAVGAEAVILAAKLEAEAAGLPEAEAREVLRAYGLEEPGLWSLVRAAQRVLDLVTFFSTDSREVRAWSVPRGTKAPQAAGQIHSDMERGFIRAEVINWETLVRVGSLKAAHDHGQIALEGRDYVVRDGDVIHFRFAV
ncbi:MAG: redox-regulated ATPase YchF [Armatimonadota bacterium]|nr:redox-regulated ATPase YchF [Armatimonadota bacterium]MDR7450940.1 redox-regulated ATPase YchF [Armatimonadota bacterium]MDR7465862.1 redox-regulated ATPase YchF [Armatimonadota bacterium]MDR7493770.1 redox-regulated ATPase YchF [Armatimonadota bacterium]MDR7498376.1 redox-regulated ATPase YchF [Armatimonadota bacterium]